MHSTLKSGLLIFLALGLLSVFTLSAQSNKTTVSPDPRLYQVMDKAYLNQISQDQPDLIMYYNYYLENSFYVVNLNNEKPVTGTDIHTVTSALDGHTGEKFAEKSFNASEFNVFKYNFDRDLNNFKTYVWEEAGVALVFRPVRHFKTQFDQYLNGR